MKAALLSFVVCCLACASCRSTYHVAGARGALAGGGTARIVVHPDDSGDAVIRRTLERELVSRGFTIVDSGPARLHVKMSDTWYWDIIMYLLQLDLVFTDASTGAVKAQAHYRNSPFHGYPSQSSVVEALFQNLEARGIFARRN